MYNKVFVSYAKEDYETAKKIYDFLLERGYDVWLDKEKLLPGQDWNTEIRQSLRKSDFVILLLSNISVAKRGYVQREFKLALEYCEEKLDTDIYVIPCKIDNCEVPDKLCKYQWAELKNENSFDLIYNSLNIQKQKYEQIERIKIAMNTSFEFKERAIKKEFGNKPKSNIDIVYPQFVDITNEDIKMLNTFIENSIFESFVNFRKPYGTTLFDETENNDDSYLWGDNELQISYKFELLTTSIISYTTFHYQYASGAAHGLYGTRGHNYLLNSLREFDLETLLDSKTEVLETLYLLCKQKLLQRAKKEFDIDDENHFFLNENPLEKKWDTFGNFYLKQNAIVILFGIYQETAYALGEHEIEILFDEILTKHDNLASLKKIKEILNSI